MRRNPAGLCLESWSLPPAGAEKVLPVLDHFNIQASVAAGVPVPLQYLLWSLVYCGLYSAIAMLLALTLFEVDAHNLAIHQRFDLHG